MVGVRVDEKYCRCKGKPVSANVVECRISLKSGWGSFSCLPCIAYRRGQESLCGRNFAKGRKQRASTTGTSIQDMLLQASTT